MLLAIPRMSDRTLFYRMLPPVRAGLSHSLCLRQRKRWRAKAQLIGEQELDSQPDEIEELASIMGEPDFKYEKNTLRSASQNA
jgi:hypothetical protein